MPGGEGGYRLVSWHTKYRGPRTLQDCVVKLLTSGFGKGRGLVCSGEEKFYALVQPEDHERGGYARPRNRRRSPADASRGPQLGSVHHGVREATGRGDGSGESPDLRAPQVQAVAPEVPAHRVEGLEPQAQPAPPKYIHLRTRSRGD